MQTKGRIKEQRDWVESEVKSILERYKVPTYLSGLGCRENVQEEDRNHKCVVQHELPQVDRMVGAPERLHQNRVS